jgi:hypothetical protein
MRKEKKKNEQGAHFKIRSIARRNTFKVRSTGEREDKRHSVELERLQRVGEGS